MKKISSVTTPSGIIGVFALPIQPPLKKLGAGIVLANISDPGNMGTLIRTCVAMGKQTVVVIDGADPWNPKVVQATAGTIANVQIFQTTWQQMLTLKKSKNLVGMIVLNAQNSINKSHKNALFVVGNEAHVLPENWLAANPKHRWVTEDQRVKERSAKGGL